ncbi:MAG: GrpB family protein [Sandaracinaceae bacterium]|nr:GrpB family protein [Sandaracinaceae bacterium]
MIRVLEPDLAWAEQYAREVVRIALHAKRALGRTEHVGGTAVPWLAARRTIDMLAFVSDDAHREGLGAVLRSIGYSPEARSEDPYVPPTWRYEGERSVRLFLVDEHDPFATDALLVRDYLRTHRTLADAYGAFKLEIAAREGVTEAAYAAAKIPFLESILRQANAPR